MGSVITELSTLEHPEMQAETALLKELVTYLKQKEVWVAAELIRYMRVKTAFSIQGQPLNVRYSFCVLHQFNQGSMSVPANLVIGRNLKVVCEARPTTSISNGAQSSNEFGMNDERQTQEVRCDRVDLPLHITEQEHVMASRDFTYKRQKRCK